MENRFTEEQLNNVDKAMLIRMFLALQEQAQAQAKELQDLNEKMQLMMEFGDICHFALSRILLAKDGGRVPRFVTISNPAGYG